MQGNTFFRQLTIPTLTCISLLSGLGLYFFMQPDGVIEPSWFHISQVLLLIPALYVFFKLIYQAFRPSAGQLLMHIIQQEQVYFHGHLKDERFSFNWLFWIILPGVTLFGLNYVIMQDGPLQYGIIALITGIFIAGMVPVISRQLTPLSSHFWLTEQGVIFYGDEYIEITWEDLKSVEWRSESLNFYTHGHNSPQFKLPLSVKEFNSFLSPVRRVLKKHSVSCNW